MKKIIFILVSLFILTGCDVEYNLEIVDDNINETVSVFLENNSDNKDKIDSLINYDAYAVVNSISQKKYDKEVIKSDNKVNVNFKYNYLFDGYRKSSLFNSCYENYGLHYDDKYYYITTSEKFNCMVYDFVPIDNVKIKIKSIYKVIDNNADEIIDDVYVWNINSSNADNKPIKFVFDKNTYDNVEDKNDFILLGIIIIIGIGLILFGILWLVSKHKDKL